MADLITTYQDAWLALIQTIAAKEARGSLAQFEAAMLADVQAILTDLDASTRDWIEQQMPLLYQQGQIDAVRQLAGHGLVSDTLSTSFAGVHKPAVETLANNLYGDLTDAQQMVGRRLQDMFRQAGLEAVTRKVSTGQTVKEAQAKLRQSLATQGVAAFTDSRGAQWSLDTYANMVIRSTTREATNQGRINQQTQLGYDLVTIPSHFPTCEICAVYQGRIYSVSGKTPGYPKLYETAFRSGYSNIHPNCGHSAVPYVPALADDAAGDQERSNAPFEDSRSERERDAYLDGQATKRAARADRNQWERYKAVLPNDAPTFAGFRAMKAAGSTRYQELQSLYREANRAATTP